MNRSANALWQGDLKTGKGQISSESGAFKEMPYSFKTRFEDAPGTNPEELIAAAHAGCFSMALSAELGKAGLKAKEIHTTATVSLEKEGSGFKIGKIHLQTRGSLENGHQEQFLAAAKQAKENCPVSKLLNAQITMDVSE